MLKVQIDVGRANLNPVPEDERCDKSAIPDTADCPILRAVLQRLDAEYESDKVASWLQEKVVLTELRKHEPVLNKEESIA